MIDYGLLQRHSVIYAKMDLRDIKQPVDLSSNLALSQPVFERVRRALRSGQVYNDAADTAWLHERLNRVQFALVAAALGCPALVLQLLGRDTTKWELGQALHSVVVALAYSGVRMLTEPDGQEMTWARKSAAGGKLILDWAAVKVAAVARKMRLNGKIAMPAWEHVAKLTAGYGMPEADYIKLVFDTRREVKRLNTRDECLQYGIEFHT
jgi:hypothetical protein